jgi:hypothetical protein
MNKTQTRKSLQHTYPYGGSCSRSPQQKRKDNMRKKKASWVPDFFFLTAGLSDQLVYELCKEHFASPV